MKIGDTEIVPWRQGFAVAPTMLHVDGDGGYRTFGPPTKEHPNSGSGLDDLRNAGKPGDWYGVVTDSSARNGTPIVQGPSDPAPGFYVSPTALADPSKRASDPRRYVDSGSIPYISLPPEALTPLGVKLGDVATVVRASTRAVCHALIADVGPRGRVGEGSMALCRALGFDDNPRHGGAEHGVVYVLWPGAHVGWPATVAQIDAAASARFDVATPANMAGPSARGIDLLVAAFPAWFV